MDSCSFRTYDKFEEGLDIKHPYMKNKQKKINVSQNGVAYRQNINKPFSVRQLHYLHILVISC